MRTTRKKAIIVVIRAQWTRWAAVAALCVLCTLLLLPAQGRPPGMPSWWPAPTVVIDPGHGGYDPGVRTGSGPDEKEITLQISKQLAEILRERGFQAILTRTDDRDYAQSGQQGREAKRTDLDARIAVAEAHRAAVFISIHCNSSPEATRGGAETFFNPALPGSRSLADHIQFHLRKIPGMSPRDIHDGSQYYLLQHVTMPAVIVEAGYLKIPADREKLADAGYQFQIALAVAEGIGEFLREWTK
ncbi:MAG: N-acetylmuramoyl-L-alanine amidase [Alicyclobacillaceae bacterium]|nr:N-acetylmuramoyl-L-alanine amidase [Alicyclobacillaceae bacterium]